MRRTVALIAFCLATPVLIPIESYAVGAALWAVSLALVLRDPDARYRLRMGVLLGLVALLAIAPIHTDTGNRHFITLGLFFLAAILAPYLVLRRYDPETLTYGFWPKRFRWRDIIYVVMSIPLSWGIIELYFFHINPTMPTQWPLPPEPDNEAIWRLAIGINCVGIWDELFFINTVYAILRSIYPHRIANLAQAVLYTSVLNDMAFVGIGPVVVYGFALTQGAMYEGSRSLLYVLIVHLIVDLFLVAAILQYHYPQLTGVWF